MLDIKLKKNKDMYPNSNWVVGNYVYRKKNYLFNAKVYELPSIYGINNGNISKLWVKNLDIKKEVFSYDRGLEIGKESQIESGMIKELIDWLQMYVQGNLDITM